MDIVILKQDKGNGVVILNKVDYIMGINEIVNDKHNFKKLSSLSTRNREGKLQHFLKVLKTKIKVIKIYAFQYIHQARNQRLFMVYLNAQNEILKRSTTFLTHSVLHKHL